MSDTLQVADLVNGKLDVGSIAGVAMVGTTADTITNRDGVEIDTLEGRLKKVGFEPPVAYSAGIEFLTAADAVKSFDNGGIVYGCLASSRPFTTTGNFATDEPNFFVIQDTGGSGNVRADQSNTYAPGTTQAFAAATADSISTTSVTTDSISTTSVTTETLSVDGVDFTEKNQEQDETIDERVKVYGGGERSVIDLRIDSSGNIVGLPPAGITTSLFGNNDYIINSTINQAFTVLGIVPIINTEPIIPVCVPAFNQLTYTMFSVNGTRTQCGAFVTLLFVT